VQQSNHHDRMQDGCLQSKTSRDGKMGNHRPDALETGTMSSFSATVKHRAIVLETNSLKKATAISYFRE
jgi:hypothetical protein